VESVILSDGVNMCSRGRNQNRPVITHGSEWVGGKFHNESEFRLRIFFPGRCRRNRRYQRRHDHESERTQGSPPAVMLVSEYGIRIRSKQVRTIEAVLQGCRPGGNVMNFKVAGLMAIAVAVLAHQAQAHHSFAMFDHEKTITVSGSLTEFEYTNPHCWLHIAV